MKQQWKEIDTAGVERWGKMGLGEGEVPSHDQQIHNSAVVFMLQSPRVPRLLDVKGCIDD